MRGDLPGIVDCAVRFFEYADYARKYSTSLDENSFRGMVEKYIGADDGVCLVAVNGDDVKGGICGAIIPWGFNKSIKMGFELFWWMDPDVRGTIGVRLFDEYEKRVEAKGARNIMVCPETHLSHKVAKLYERRGYKMWESFWIK